MNLPLATSASNPSAPLPQYCHHCGAITPEGSQLQAIVAGRMRVFCSKDCRTTAEWIEQTGLGDFYRLRKGASQRPEQTGESTDWHQAALLEQVLSDQGNGLFDVSLLVEGMHCAACVWLIERVLLKLGGVTDIQINPVTHRALLRFNSTQTTLADILQALRSAGYQPRPLQTGSIQDARSKENRDLLKRLLVAGFAMMQVMTYSFVLYMENLGELPGGTKELFRWLGFLVSTPVVFYSAAPFFKGAFSSLKLRLLNMDVPIAIAIAAVYGSSVFQALRFQGEVYFESVSMLVFFLLVGRYVEMRARHRSVDSADALTRLTPDFAERRNPDGTLSRVPVGALQEDDCIQVQEGAYLPADGILLSARALLDEALMSGEANARLRVQGDSVIAGSLALEGPLDVRVTRVGSGTFLATLARLSNRAQTQRPKLSRRSERLTANFVLRVLVMTAITLAGWLWYDPTQALEATIALLVVACPCALGLAAPAAITRALGVLARKNILVIKPDALDTLTRIDLALFDKTGTLTEPQLAVDSTDSTLLQLAASLARESRHPLSRALVAANTLPLLAVTETRSFPGLGLEGNVQGRCLRLGQARFALSGEQATQYQDASLVLAEQGKLLALFQMDEQLRADSKLIIRQLESAGIQCQVVSGDSEFRVQKTAHQLGIHQFHGRQQPAEKLACLKQLHEAGHCVMAVGDGSNDAPVLAGADISVALTSGTELAQANADILLCDGRLSRLNYARQIAHETRHILRQNEFWAISYNTLAMPAAALGYIPPWLAAIFMSASSLAVVLNALRIGRSTSTTQPVAEFNG